MSERTLTNADLIAIRDVIANELMLYASAYLTPMHEKHAKSITELQKSVGLLMDGQALVEKALSDTTTPDWWHDEPPSEDA